MRSYSCTTRPAATDVARFPVTCRALRSASATGTTDPFVLRAVHPGLSPGPALSPTGSGEVANRGRSPSSLNRAGLDSGQVTPGKNPGHLLDRYLPARYIYLRVAAHPFNASTDASSTFNSLGWSVTKSAELRDSTARHRHPIHPSKSPPPLLDYCAHRLHGLTATKPLPLCTGRRPNSPRLPLTPIQHQIIGWSSRRLSRIY